MPSPAYKRCSRCGEEKPLDEFYPRKDVKDGREGRCKACARAKTRAWREGDPELVSAAYRRWRLSNPKAREEGRKRHRKRHPEKARARRILNLAVHRGTILKPTHCEACGQEFEKSDLHGHHHDYSKPLEVEWFCGECHRAQHSPDQATN